MGREEANTEGWETIMQVLKSKEIMKEQNKAGSLFLPSHVNTHIFFKTPEMYFLGPETLKTSSFLDSLRTARLQHFTHMFL